jgi:hypothetical protein
LGADWIETLNLFDGMDENPSNFATKWTEWMRYTLETLFFYIARFEVQVLGKELYIGKFSHKDPRLTISGVFLVAPIVFEVNLQH